MFLKTLKILSTTREKGYKYIDREIDIYLLLKSLVVNMDKTLLMKSKNL